MLLAEGHLVYSGPASDVVDWMGRFGLQVPFGTSIAGARGAHARAAAAWAAGCLARRGALLCRLATGEAQVLAGWQVGW